MRKAFLPTMLAAGLIAGSSVVYAQSAKDQKDQPSASPNGQMRSQENAPNGGKSDMQKAQPSAPSTTGQGSPSTNQRRQEPPTQAPNRSDQGGMSGQGNPSTERSPSSSSPSSSGQGSSGQGSTRQAPMGSTPGAAQTPSAPSQTQGRAQTGGESVTLTPEQKTTIRQSVLARAPRQSNVNFSLTVGTAVPTTVRLVAVPEPLFRIHPAWRGHLYFVVGDEIIIVDARTHQIVAVIAV